MRVSQQSHQGLESCSGHLQTCVILKHAILDCGAEDLKKECDVAYKAGQKPVLCEEDCTERQLTAFRASLEARAHHVLSDLQTNAAGCHAIHSKASSKSQACNDTTSHA